MNGDGSSDAVASFAGPAAIIAAADAATAGDDAATGRGNDPGATAAIAAHATAADASAAGNAPAASRGRRSRGRRRTIINDKKLYFWKNPEEDRSRTDDVERKINEKE